MAELGAPRLQPGASRLRRLLSRLDVHAAELVQGQVVRRLARATHRRLVLRQRVRIAISSIPHGLIQIWR